MDWGMNKTLKRAMLTWIGTILIALAGPAAAQSGPTGDPERFASWTSAGEGEWIIKENRSDTALKGISPRVLLSWHPEHDSATGLLRSPVFRIEKAVQDFCLAGVTGFDHKRLAASPRFRLRLARDGSVLRESVVNGYTSLSRERWYTPELIGKKVYLEIESPALKNFFGGPAGSLSLENYLQVDFPVPEDPVETDLYAVEVDKGARLTYCRSIPFLASDPGLRKATTRKSQGNSEFIPVGARAETLFLLGMINLGWENGVAHWGEHPETREVRDDQVYAGKQLGSLVIHYAGENRDTIPLVMGSTMWFSQHWTHGASHDVALPTMEPFASRAGYMDVLRNTLRVREDEYPASHASDYRHFYLPVLTRNRSISSIEIIDDPGTRGVPLVSAITLKGNKQEGLIRLPSQPVSASDLEAALDPGSPPDYRGDALRIARLLYNRVEDMPEHPEALSLPANLDATSITFLGAREAVWLSNIWAANLVQIHGKFDAETGYFMETGEDCPFYGGYSGMGTWSVQGIYPAAYSRTSDHFATLAMRHINLPRRETSFVDFCDKWLYFYRPNRDPLKGPPNDLLDLDRYPADAPPHWSMELSRPPTTGGELNVNEIHGDEEMDGHAATLVARWYAWKLQGGGAGPWLMDEREDIYGHSRWESTRDATEFICWLMDYTGRDLVYSEGEFTGWGGIGRDYCQVPPGMSTETDPEKIRRNYANANMYEPYPNFACMTALRCAAQMAEAAGEDAYAVKWRQRADIIREAMLRLLIAGDFNKLTWKIAPHSVLTTFQDRLVQAWFSLYMDGLDSRQWDQEMLNITRNTFHEHMEMPYGHAPVLAMGYGQGWLTHASLLLDEMDHAGKLLVNTAIYSYDKNMDYRDPERGIDWRKWCWIVPEGANLLPDGSWHRINDLSNGANQGPVMHALEACAGVDDSDPDMLRIMPRIPDPLRGVEVKNHMVLIPVPGGLKKIRIAYSFKREGVFGFRSSEPVPAMSVRLGPWDLEEAEKRLGRLKSSGFAGRIEKSGVYGECPAWWLWIEGLDDCTELDINLNTR